MQELDGRLVVDVTLMDRLAQVVGQAKFLLIVLERDLSEVHVYVCDELHAVLTRHPDRGDVTFSNELAADRPRMHVNQRLRHVVLHRRQVSLRLRILLVIHPDDTLVIVDSGDVLLDLDRLTLLLDHRHRLRGFIFLHQLLRVPHRLRGETQVDRGLSGRNQLLFGGGHADHLRHYVPQLRDLPRRDLRDITVRRERGRVLEVLLEAQRLLDVLADFVVVKVRVDLAGVGNFLHAGALLGVLAERELRHRLQVRLLPLEIGPRCLVIRLAERGRRLVEAGQVLLRRTVE